MKITVQEKIAELERRIVTLESKQPHQSATYTKTTTTSTSPLSTDQQGAMDRMWTHFDHMFAEMGKLFR